MISAPRTRLLVSNALVVVLSMLATAGGCPFETRDAVPPDTGEDIPPECQFGGATQPGDVLRNYEIAFGCETFGVETLRESLAPAFDFEAPDEDASVQEFVDAWGNLIEAREGPVGQFTQQMGALLEGQAAEITLDAQDGDETSAPGGDGFVYENVPYVLEFLNGAEVFSRFEGQADIFVRLEGTNYVAYRWIDIDQGFPTMARFWFGGTAAGATGRTSRAPRD